MSPREPNCTTKCVFGPCGNYTETTHIYYVPDVPKDSEWSNFMLMAAIASICSVFIITVIAYYVYFRWYSNTLRQAERLRRRRISRGRRFSWRRGEDHFRSSHREGLGRAMVDALPVFVYKPESFTDGLRCAVCLCEFEENEKARMLPSCNHSFHVDCIDMWFYSHSTCPLCRATVEAQSEETVESRPPTQIEVPVAEAVDDKELINSSSGSPAAEQNNDCDESRETEEGDAPHVVTIDIPSREK